MDFNKQKVNHKCEECDKKPVVEPNKENTGNDAVLSTNSVRTRNKGLKAPKSSKKESKASKSPRNESKPLKDPKKESKASKGREKKSEAVSHLFVTKRRKRKQKFSKKLEDLNIPEEELLREQEMLIRKARIDVFKKDMAEKCKMQIPNGNRLPSFSDKDLEKEENSQGEQEILIKRASIDVFKKDMADKSKMVSSNGNPVPSSSSDKDLKMEENSEDDKENFSR